MMMTSQKIGLNGATDWSFLCLVSPCQWGWVTFGGFRLPPKKMVAALFSFLTWSYWLWSVALCTTWKWPSDNFPVAATSKCTKNCHRCWKVRFSIHRCRIFRTVRRFGFRYRIWAVDWIHMRSHLLLLSYGHYLVLFDPFLYQRITMDHLPAFLGGIYKPHWTHLRFFFGNHVRCE